MIKIKIEVNTKKINKLNKSIKKALAKALNKIGQASRKVSNKAVDTFLNKMEKGNK